MTRKINPDVLLGQEIVKLPGRSNAQEAACLMRDQNVGSVVIMEGDRLAGIFTVADMAYRVVAENRSPGETRLADVMTANPDTVDPKTTEIEALRMMQDGGYRHLPVVEDGKVIGVVSRRDFHGTEKARLEDETALWERIG